MKDKFPIADCRLPGRAVSPLTAGGAHGATRPTRSIENGFTLVEVMVVIVLLSLIVFALLAVFNATQTAFRATVTQSGVLESGRATMDLMADDLRAMSPSDGYTNRIVNNVLVPGAANFYAAVSSVPPLIQPMVGGNSRRTNVLENFFILSRGNASGVPTWYGVGYAVAATNVSGSLYSLYRFETNYPVAGIDPVLIFTRDFGNFLNNVTGGSHLLDGVVDLTVRPDDVNGYQMTNTYQFDGGQWVTNQNVWFFAPAWGEVGFVMFSNTLPAAVQVEMAVLEDRALQRAESIPVLIAQSNYLAQQAGKVHIFRQRVSIPNVDPSAYQ